MNGAEFIRKIQRIGRQRSVPVRFVARRGKGSHGTLFFGESFTIVQNLKRELPSGTLREMLRQIGLGPNDLL